MICLSLVARLSLDIAGSVRAGTGILFGLLKFTTAFTHLTNALIGLVLYAFSESWGSQNLRPFRKPWVLACTATYITVMALTWKVALAPTFSDGFRLLAESFTLERVVGVFLHGVNPMLFLCFWLFFAPKRQLRWTQPFLWPVGAVVYFIGILIRGAVQGIYPYPFVDVGALGFVTVFGNAVLLLIFFVAVGLAFVAIDRWDPIESLMNSRMVS